MARKLAIIHTTPVTVDTFRQQAERMQLECDIVNFVDDSILPRLAANGGDVAEIAPKLVQYARYAEEAGADVILSACSSVGEAAAAMRSEVSVPVVRIDDAMAEEAVKRGDTIGIVATLETTIRPTTALLMEKARAAGKDVQFIPVLAGEAYRLLKQGDKEGHDRILLDLLADLASRADVIVLAQASMSRVSALLEPEQRDKCLTSPAFALAYVKSLLAETKR
ncbi:hypothetical protein SD70_26530 [Gordoniibacillus kamchatkensis]|uniref:Asp/Glu/hydantoin racemase n=1 Tax=Gordoniibacillus kamchatkensis TaxID=1590651 RepID=A0ABR5ABL7_9BACL|nr:aspartate/glutamate racemase family protein [Paenibacillus sp. VKM B-2647]KIL38419.1 hypothetical protein SD70_26530 [Paenibacillus sp. VKM B-2647]